LNLIEMMDAAAAGRLKALWAIGYDVFLTNPHATATARALKSLELVIVQDLFLNQTAREFATVFLPACSSFEKATDSACAGRSEASRQLEARLADHRGAGARDGT
jgi:predicted molibdopterin-dependent oxidoreductase YjgC